MSKECYMLKRSLYLERIAYYKMLWPKNSAYRKSVVKSYQKLLASIRSLYYNNPNRM